MGGPGMERTAQVRQRLTSLALVVTVLTGGVAVRAGFGWAETPPACEKPSDVEIVQLLNRWRAEFSSGRPDRISELYAADATLIVTKDGKVYKGRDAIGAYYKEFLARRPVLSIKPATLKPGCGTASVSGPAVYRVTGERKGTRMLLGGRYTADFALSNGSWLIVRHSLAADPRGIGDAFGANAAKP